jgi:methionyl-tRNA formyltransferase
VLCYNNADLVTHLEVVCPQEKVQLSEEAAAASKAKVVLVRRWANSHGIPVHNYDKQNVSPLIEAAKSFDTAVVVDFGYLIPTQLLASFRCVHPIVLEIYA